jgi:hypothetical protein
MSNNSISKQNYIGLIVFMLGVFALGPARALPKEPSNNQGLLSKLIEIKYTSELYLSSALKQGSNKDSALGKYNTLRWKLDGFIYQLSADMIAANSHRKMILLNAWCLEERNNETNENIESVEVKKNNQHNDINKGKKTSKNSMKKILVFVNALTEIENFYQNQILPSLYRNKKTLISVPMCFIY